MKSSELIKMAREQGKRIEALEAEVRFLKRKVKPAPVDAISEHRHYPSGRAWGGT